MSTGVIIAIVVVVLIVVAIFAVVMPRMRRSAQIKARERELGQRREQVADHHRTQSSEREREADMAERKAQIAQAEAQKQRAESQMEAQRADMHERGMADHELVGDNEREHFAPAMNDGETLNERPVEGGTAHEPVEDDRPARFGRGGTTSETEAERAGTEPRRS